MKLRHLGFLGLSGFLGLTACSADSPPVEPRAVQGAFALVADGQIVSETASAESFQLFAGGQASPIFLSAGDFPGVVRAANNLQSDMESVGGVKPVLSQSDTPAGSNVIVVGSLGKNPFIDSLVTAGKLDVSSIKGKWESFIVQSVTAPAAGIDKALVIVGSDKRGTIYGVYQISEEMGVSPWHYFADVPAKKQPALYVSPGSHSLGEPAVKYRGFFINDEAPALMNWYTSTFKGTAPGLNSAFYEKVFDLLLRMKGNYLWPGMWGKAFNTDDLKNPQLADEYGVVMGTSHHEPLTRAEQEWYDAGRTAEQWSYSQNGAALREFWKGGVQRMGTRESLLTVGMRGSGDVANPDQGVPLMESIVTAQRQIIQDVTGKNPAQVPQVWTLYKEVQSYYDDGMKVPDDVTLMFADDNWGNIRRLPPVGKAPRSGGYGVYYHFDYVGGPRSYKWLNTNPIPRVWEQMRRAYHLGAKQVWIVNVGDIKPMEYPLQFFMDLAWNPEGWTAARLADYPRRWAKAQFGTEHAEAIGRLVSMYSKFNGRRKPELLSGSTYSVDNFREATTVVNDYQALVEQAESIEKLLPADQKDAYFQLVLHPILACANLNAMYVAQGKNSRFAAQGRASTNTMATRVNDTFANDTTITNRYHTIKGGKWNHMMDQTHIGYTTWDQPASQVRPSTQTIQASGAAAVGVSIEGSTAALVPSSAAGTLPELSAYYPQEARFIEVFNRGAGSFDYQAKSDVAYVTITPSSGTLSADVTLEVKADFSQVPAGKSTATITISGAGGDVDLKLPLNNPASPSPASVVGFVETNGRVSADASHYTANVKKGAVGWSIIPDLGRTGNAVHIQPDEAASVTPGTDSPRLEYKMHLAESGQVQVQVYLSPSLPVTGTHYRYAISFDDQAPQTVDIHSGLPNDFNDSAPVWEGWVSDNIIVKSTNLTPSGAGEHTLKLWMVDAGVVVQKIVVSRGAPPASYLGAPTRLPLNTTIEVVTPDRGATAGPGGGAGGASATGGASSGTTGGSAPASGGNSAAAAAGGLGTNPGAGTGAGGGGGSATNPGSGGSVSPSAGAAGQPGNDSGCSCATQDRAQARRAPGVLLAFLLASWTVGRRWRRGRRLAV
jgi:hypothetical protein